MFRSLTTLAFGLSLVTGLVLAQPAAAQRVFPAKGSAEGPVTITKPPTEDDPVGEQTFKATGVGTLIGKHTTCGHTIFNVLDGSVKGTFTATAADGSEIFGRYTGFFFEIPESDDIGFVLTVFWEGGTGRFVGVSGEASVEAIQGVDPESGQLMTIYEYDGEFILP